MACNGKKKTVLATRQLLTASLLSKAKKKNNHNNPIRPRNPDLSAMKRHLVKHLIVSIRRQVLVLADLEERMLFCVFLPCYL